MVPETAELDQAVRLFVFQQAADTGRVPAGGQIAEGLGQPRDAVDAALQRLAAGRALILAPGSTNIWVANPFSAVPSAFRVQARGRTYWGICIWDALGIPAALRADATVEAQCGDCGQPLRLEVRGGSLVHDEGVVHFGVPAVHWWDNIGFT